MDLPFGPTTGSVRKRSSRPPSHLPNVASNPNPTFEHFPLSYGSADLRAEPYQSISIIVDETMDIQAKPSSSTFSLTEWHPS